MEGQDVLATVRTLIDADPEVSDRDELAVMVRLMGVTRAWIDAFEIRIAARAAALATDGACESAATLLEGGGRRSARQAETAARRSKVCAQLPALDRALAEGRISGEHVDAVADVARTLNELGLAEHHDPPTRRHPLFRRQHHQPETKTPSGVNRPPRETEPPAP